MRESKFEKALWEKYAFLNTLKGKVGLNIYSICEWRALRWVLFEDVKALYGEQDDFPLPRGASKEQLRR